MIKIVKIKFSSQLTPVLLQSGNESDHGQRHGQADGVPALLLCGGVRVRQAALRLAGPHQGRAQTEGPQRGRR